MYKYKLKHLSNEDYILFKKMISDGYFSDEIINYFKITKSKYKSIINKFSLKSNKKTSIKIIDKDAKLAQCNECNRVLNLEDNFYFKIKPNGYGFYRTYCNNCHYKKRDKHINSNIELFLSTRHTNVKNKARVDNVTFEMSKQDFYEIYYKQKGLCFYTDLPMIWILGSGKQRDALSVDKIIPNLGYTNGNVVFCLNRINMAKHDFCLEEIKKWMPDWYFRIQTYLNNNKIQQMYSVINKTK